MLENIKQIIKEAGRIIRSAHHIESNKKSNFRDIVTKYDLEVQDFVQAELAKLVPNADFIGEEQKNNTSTSAKCFIVDPIDGTANFRYGFQKSACSIAYAEQGEVLLGCVYDPYLDELFYAEKGKGAYCNGRPLVPLSGGLNQGIAIFGTSPYAPETTAQTFALAQLCYGESMDLRRFGAAALDLCYVADGRAICFFEGSLSPWDFAAGKCIIEEVGLCMRTWEDDSMNLFAKNSCICGNPEAVEQWFGLLRKVRA